MNLEAVTQEFMHFKGGSNDFFVMSACFRSLIGTDDVSILWKGEMMGSSEFSMLFINTEKVNLFRAKDHKA
jgi:hypothetical protein